MKYSNEQAKGIQQKILDKYSLDVSTYVGMRYWYPFTEEALEEIQKDGIEALVIVPLYPQFSISTSGSSLRVLQEEFARNSHLWGNRGKSAGSLAPSFTHTVIPSWYDRPGYIKAMADIIQKELDSFTQDDIDEQLSPEVPVLARELAEWILADALPVRFQLQLHKIIWADAKGK